MDLLGTALQDGGNKDTMIVLIADTAGGFIIAMWAGIQTSIHKQNQKNTFN
ncbi:hypothetical protein [Domibacillus epiphyticus]|uniref:hypothetical protein n=1 Tax=Domibacillus epiphyticus TaxID=1714355 RepID=UPI001300FDA6|nr:hypothetical protein [Domibacillus epiphyticus]